MKLKRKNKLLLIITIFFLFNQNLTAEETTKVSCENKSNIDVKLRFPTTNERFDKTVCVKSGSSGSIEWTGDFFLRNVNFSNQVQDNRGFNISRPIMLEILDEISVGNLLIKELFEKKLKGKFTTGPRNLKITITNSKITTLITDSENKNPETIIATIIPPIKNETTKIHCENKSDVDIDVMIYRAPEEKKILNLESKKSQNIEWTGNPWVKPNFVYKIGIKAKEQNNSKFNSLKFTEFEFKQRRAFESNGMTGPRDIKIIVKNDKTTCIMTDSKNKNPETTTLDSPFAIKTSPKDQRTKISCENKLNKDIEIMFSRHFNEGMLLNIKSGKSKNLEYTSNDFISHPEITVVERNKDGFNTSKYLKYAFNKKLEGKFKTGPRSIKIIVNNNKIITELTNSENKNPETVVTNIEAPIKNKSTKVSCENKSNIDIELIFYVDRNKSKKLNVKSNKSDNTEWIGKECVETVVINSLKDESPGFSIMKSIGAINTMYSDGKFIYGPRNIKIVITNNKITTILTDSKDSKTIITDIKPTLS